MNKAGSRNALPVLAAKTVDSRSGLLVDPPVGASGRTVAGALAKAVSVVVVNVVVVNVVVAGASNRAGAANPARANDRVAKKVHALNGVVRRAALGAAGPQQADGTGLRRRAVARRAAVAGLVPAVAVAHAADKAVPIGADPVRAAAAGVKYQRH